MKIVLFIVTQNIVLEIGETHFLLDVFCDVICNNVFMTCLYTSG